MPTYNFLGIHFERILTAVTHKKNFSFDKFQGKEKFGKFSPLRQKPKEGGWQGHRNVNVKNDNNTRKRD